MKKDLQKIKEQVGKDYAKRFTKLFEYNFYTGGDIMGEAGEEQPPADQSPAPVDVSPQSQLPQNEVPQVPSESPPQIEEPPMDSSDEFEDIEIDSDDNVVDITDLTNAQEETNNDVAALDSRFDQFNQFAEKLTQALEKIVQRAEENESEIQAVKDEIIKRSPTSTEKLNIRVLDSQPYNQPIADYWKNKAAENPKYEIVADNQPKQQPEEEYVLRDSDGEDASDFEMYNSFNNNLRNLVGI
jgi:hypothetical protein